MSGYRSRTIPILLVAVFGLLQLVEYYYPEANIKAVALTSRNWGVLLASIAVGVGALTLSLRNVRQVQQKAEGWIYNLWSIILLIITIAVGLLPPLGANEYITWLYDTVFQPVGATLYALLCFFICSAAFRAFKVRSKEAALMMVCAILIMLRNAPITRGLFPIFATIGDWIYEIPNAAGSRAITISGGLGIILIGLRMFLGRERAVVGERA